MYKVVSGRFQHDFQRVLNESEKDGYKLQQYTHDNFYHFGVLWKDDDA